MQSKPGFWRWAWDCLRLRSIAKELVEANTVIEFIAGFNAIGLGIAFPLILILHARTGQAWYLLLFALIPLGVLLVLHGWYREFVQGRDS